MSISIRNSEGYLDLTAYHALCRIEREEKGKSRRKYMPKVYIISPFAGDVERNTSNARRYCFFAVKQGYIPFAAHLFFPQILNDCNPTERQLGLFMGMVYLDGCREAWVFGERISSGMAAEIARAEKRNIKLRYFTENCEEV